MCTRRSVLLVAVGTALGCGGSGVAAVAPSRDGRVSLPLAQHPGLQNAGGHAVIEADDRKIIVMRPSATEVVALSAVCTHQGCLVSWAPDASEIQCPCHGSRFSAQGQVLQGPAEEPLAKYEARLEGDTVVVTLGGPPR